jgi:hypothetical protein
MNSILQSRSEICGLGKQSYRPNSCLESAQSEAGRSPCGQCFLLALRLALAHKHEEKARTGGFLYQALALQFLCCLSDIPKLREQLEGDRTS